MVHLDEERLCILGGLGGEVEQVQPVAEAVAPSRRARDGARQRDRFAEGRVLYECGGLPPGWKQGDTNVTYRGGAGMSVPSVPRKRGRDRTTMW